MTTLLTDYLDESVDKNTSENENDGEGKAAFSAGSKISNEEYLSEMAKLTGQSLAIQISRFHENCELLLKFFYKVGNRKCRLYLRFMILEMPETLDLQLMDDLISLKLVPEYFEPIFGKNVQILEYELSRAGNPTNTSTKRRRLFGLYGNSNENGSTLPFQFEIQLINPSQSQNFQIWGLPSKLAKWDAKTQVGNQVRYDVLQFANIFTSTIEFKGFKIRCSGVNNLKLQTAHRVFTDQKGRKRRVAEKNKKFRKESNPDRRVANLLLHGFNQDTQSVFINK